MTMQPKQPTQKGAIAPDTTHLTQRFLNQRTETGQNSVVHNLLKTIRSAGSAEIRQRAEETLRKYWSHDTTAQAYFAIAEKAKADEAFRARIEELKKRSSVDSVPVSVPVPETRGAIVSHKDGELICAAEDLDEARRLGFEVLGTIQKEHGKILVRLRENKNSK